MTTTSVRLTTAARDKIAEAMLVHRFGDEAMALVGRRAALATGIYQHVYDAAMRAKMAKLPKGWMPTANSIYAQFGPERETFRFDGHTNMDIERMTRRVRKMQSREVEFVIPYNDDQRGSSRAIFDANSSFYAARETIRAEEADLRERYRSAQKQVDAALYAVTTTGRLREVWPEAAPFIALVEPATAPALPAVPVEKLNEMFRLPVAEAAE